MDYLQLLSLSCGFHDTRPESGMLVFAHDAIADATTFRFFKCDAPDEHGYGPVECEEFIDYFLSLSPEYHGCWAQYFIKATDNIEDFARIFEDHVRDFQEYVTAWKSDPKEYIA